MTTEITIDAEVRSRAGSTALELMEMCRVANRTGEVKAEIVSANDTMNVTLGMLFVMEAAFVALGQGDFSRGLATTRELVKAVIARQAESDG